MPPIVQRMDTQEPFIKPLLKWAGGKRWLAPDLKRYWQAANAPRLVEPFCGGLAVALELMPNQALLNDINPHLINLYRWLQKGLKPKFAFIHDKDAYYENRTRFNELIERGQADTQEAALLFYYLNRTGFNGLCRFNKRGFFNVPFGQYKTINYEKDFGGYQYAFRNWEFMELDFEKLPVQPADFIYADPPYDVEFVSYAKDGFDWDDQERLAAWLANHQGAVVASNQATDRIVALYTQHGFNLTYVDAPRRINSTGDRPPAKEIIATKNLSL